MSRLLYAEHRSTYLERKLVPIVSSIILLVLAVFLVVLPVITAEEYDIRLLLNGLIYALVASVVLLFLVFPSLSWQRFEIHDDRIALPRPRHASLFRYKPETIMKDDIQSAEFQIEPRGGWECTLTFKSGEVFSLNSFFVHCKEECEPAIREFLKGLLDEEDKNGDGT